MKNIHHIILKIIAFVFGLVAVLSLGTYIANLVNGTPDKISVEFESALLFNLSGAIAILSFGAISLGLWLKKKWSLWLYTILIVVWFLLLGLIGAFDKESFSDHRLEYIMCFVLFILAPCILWGYLYRQRDSFH